MFTPSAPTGCDVQAPQIAACAKTSACPTNEAANQKKAACPMTCEMFPSGRLVDMTDCMEDGYTVHQTYVLEGKVTMVADVLATNEHAVKALSAALDVPEPFIEADVKEIKERRLESHESTKVKNEINYKIYVPPGVDHEDLSASVQSLASEGAAQTAFVNKMAEQGVKVDKSTIVAPKPKATKAVLVLDKDGKLVHKPVAPVPSPAPAPSPAAEEGGNTAAIVGGIVGGLVGVAIIGGIAYYLLVVRRSKES